MSHSVVVCVFTNNMASDSESDLSEAVYDSEDDNVGDLPRSPSPPPVPQIPAIRPRARPAQPAAGDHPQVPVARDRGPWMQIGPLLPVRPEDWVPRAVVPFQVDGVGPRNPPAVDACPLTFLELFTANNHGTDVFQMLTEETNRQVFFCITHGQAAG